MVASGENPLPTNGVLMVEGQDDKHMVWQLCRRDSSSFSVSRYGYEMSVTLLTQSTAFLIAEQGSRSDLLKAIRQQIVSSRTQAVGVLVDADDDLNKCWDDLVREFLRADVQLPVQPDLGGTIIPEQGFFPRIGIWLMPDNRTGGELENFVLGMIPDDDPEWPLAQDFIEKIPCGDRKFAPEKIDKAKVYAWLAARKEPGRIGAAIGANDLYVGNPLCRDFLSWLTKLFG